MSRSKHARKGLSDVSGIPTTTSINALSPQSSFIISPPTQTATGATQQETASQEQSTTSPGHNFSQIRLYADDWNHSTTAAPTPPPAPPYSASTGSFQVQTKLAVNEPGDAFEQEADRIANLVMRSPADTSEADASPTLAMPAYYIPRLPNATAPSVTPAIEGNINQMRGGGQPMPEGERGFFEQRFGHDFSQIRIHADDHAAQTAQALNARAFTVGTDIAFDQGEYQPGTEGGRHLLAHELTHTIQQTGGVATKPIQRKAAEREPNADEGVCPVCGKVGKGTCPGCGQSFLPIQRKLRSDTVDDEIEQRAPDTQPTAGATAREPDEAPAEPAAAQAHEQRTAVQAGSPGTPDATAAPSQPTEASQSTEGNPQDAEQPSAAADAGEAAAPATEVASAPVGDQGRSKGPRAEDVATGTPVHETIRQVAEAGPRQELLNQTQKLREQMSSPAPEAEKAALPQASAQSAPAGQADPALEGALAQAQTGRDQARSQADAADAELASSQNVFGQLAGTPIELAPLDMPALLQEAGFTPEETGSSAAPGLGEATANAEPADAEEPNPVALQAQVEDVRAQAVGMLGGFMGNAAGRVQNALAQGQTAPARLQAPVAAAQAAIMAGVQSQSAALTAQFAQARLQAQSAAEAQRAQIEAQHGAALAAIQASSAQTSQQIEAGHQQAVQRVQQLEQTEIQTLTLRYAQADRDYRDAGVEVGREAVVVGEQEAQIYLGEKINGIDNLTDGDLTDRRCEARAKAAREVAKQYQAGLEEEAGKQADEAKKGVPKELETVGTIRAETLTTLENQHQAMLEQARAAAEAAQQQAEQTKTRFLETVEQTLTGTMQALDEQEASQRQGLETMGQQQVAALDQAGQSTAAALQQSVSQTVAGLQSSLGALPGALAGVQVPDPDALGKMLGEAMAQIESGLAALQDQVEQGVAAAEQQLTQQGGQVVQSLETTGQTVTASVSELVDSLTSSFAQLQSGVQSTYTQIQEGFTSQSSQIQQGANEVFGQVVQGLEQTYRQLDQDRDTALDKATPDLKEGLRGCFDDMRATIKEEAKKAAEQVQPIWKTALKALLIIAVIVVVALFVGPFVIGALGFLGPTMAALVGGAIVGAASGAVIQMGNNLIDGQPIMKGVVEAMIVGAIGGGMGAAGGLVGGALVKGAASSLSGFSQTALRLGVDMVFDTAGNIIGNVVTKQPITLEGLLQGLGMSMGMSLAMGSMNKLGRFGKGVDAIQQRSGAMGKTISDGISARVRSSFDMPSPRVDVGAPTRPDLEVGNAPAPRSPGIDEVPMATPPRTTAPDGAGGVTPARNSGVNEPTTAPRSSAADETSTAPPARNPADDNLTTAPAPRNSGDTPRLNADPERPANLRSNEELAEAAQTVKLGDEDHTVTPGKIDGETKLCMCTSCGPITNKIDAMLDTPSLDPKLKKELTALRANLTELETRISNREVSSQAIVKETNRVKDQLNALGKSHPDLGTKLDANPAPKDIEVIEKHAPDWAIDPKTGKFDPDRTMNGLKPEEVDAQARQPALANEPPVIERRRRYLQQCKAEGRTPKDMEKWAESGFTMNTNRETSKPHETDALAALGATSNNAAGQRKTHTYTESVDKNGRPVTKGTPGAVEEPENILPDGTRPSYTNKNGTDIIEHKHLRGNTEVLHDSRKLRAARDMAKTHQGEFELVMSSDRTLGKDGLPVVRPSPNVAARSSQVYYYDPASGQVTHRWAEGGWKPIDNTITP